MEKKQKGYYPYIIAEVIIIALFALSLMFTDLVGKLKNEQHIEYSPVSCTVSHINIKAPIKRGSSAKIFVEYKNKTYRLEQPDEAYMYTKGQWIKAYYYKNKIYAHEEDTLWGTPLGKLEFVLLILRFILGVAIFAVAISAFVINSRKRKELREKVNSGSSH